MKTHILLLLLLVPAAMAVTISAPSGDIEAETLPTTVNAAWAGENGTYTVVLLKDGVLQYNDSTNDTNKTYALTEGDYRLTVHQGNQSDSEDFSVSELVVEPPELSVSTDGNSYDVGETVRLTATTDKPVTATLKIKQDGATLETYTLNIQNTLNLIYIPESAGDFEAIISAEGAQDTATFTVEETEELEVDFTRTEAWVNKKTEFTAVVTGGTPPYTYQWLFSDDTASTGATSTHYFFEPGQASATLIVKDADNTQVSKEKTFTILETTYALELTVRDNDETVLKNMKVMLDNDDLEDPLVKTTGNTGMVSWTTLKGTYDMTISHADEVYHEQTITINETTYLVLTINYSTPAPVVEETTEETNTTEEAEPEPEPEIEEPLMEMLAAPEPVQEPQIEELRKEKKNTLSERRFNLQLSAKKDRVLRILELYKLFDEATKGIDKASEKELEQILKPVPKDVRIVDEKSQVTYPEEGEMEAYITEFVEAKNIQDEDLRKQYEYNIKETAKNTSVKTTIIHAIVTYQDREEAHTIVEREITTSGGTYVVEVIPKEFAKDVSKLKLDGDHEVIKSDPIIRFNTHSYTYSTAKTSTEMGYPLVVPWELKEPGMLSGFISFKFGGGSTTRSIFYVLILGIFLIGLVGGTKMTKNRVSKTNFEDFADLTEHALTLIHDGQEKTAAEITPEIMTIFEALPEKRKEALGEVVDHLKKNYQEQHFLATLTGVYGTVSSGTQDINTLSGAYEHVLSQYEQLTPEMQEELKPHLNQLDKYLDKLLGT